MSVGKSRWPKQVHRTPNYKICGTLSTLLHARRSVAAFQSRWSTKSKKNQRKSRRTRNHSLNSTELIKTSSRFQVTLTKIFLAVKTNWDQSFSTCAQLPPDCDTCTRDVIFFNRGKFGPLNPASSPVRSSVNGCSAIPNNKKVFPDLVSMQLQFNFSDGLALNF